jgi:3-oxoacyl-[acyl-carrier protein] reductase
VTDLELAGKTALVTGGTTALGRACALALADAGADVVLAYARAKGAVPDLVREIQERGRRVIAVQADVSNSAEVSNLFLEAESLGGVDILVNNAGPCVHLPLAELTDADWEDIVEPHLYGTFYCCREALPHMREQGWGRILNLVYQPEDPEGRALGAYGIARTAVLALTRALAAEEAPHGITVNALGPVWAPEGVGAPRRNGAWEADPPLRLARWEDLGRAVRYLAGPAGAGLTGLEWTIRDGWQP